MVFANNRKWRPVRLILVMLALAFIYTACQPKPAEASAAAQNQTLGYPNSQMPCQHYPYNVAGRCANYDWGPTHTEFYDDSSQYSSRGYTYRNCTDYVAWKLSTEGVKIPRGLGNATEWLGNVPAKQRLPRARVWTVAVSPGGFGHVAFVEAVMSNGGSPANDVITVSEYNFYGHGTGSIRTGKVSQLGFTAFIDFGAHPQTVAKPNVSSNHPVEASKPNIATSQSEVIKPSVTNNPVKVPLPSETAKPGVTSKADPAANLPSLPIKLPSETVKPTIPPVVPSQSHRVIAYNNYSNDGVVGIPMCRGNPGNYLSMLGGTATQTFTVPAGIGTIDSAKIAIDPDSTVTAHLAIYLNDHLAASTNSTSGGSTIFNFGPVRVQPKDSVTLEISFSATYGKIITVYTIGHPGGRFTAANSCPDGAANITTTSTGLKAIVSGRSRVKPD